jgi:hypothetical protein
LTLTDSTTCPPDLPVGPLKKISTKLQMFLLAFINNLSGGVSSIDLQNLVFLYENKLNLNYFEFLPCKSGPFSFQLDYDLGWLVKFGYLTAEEPIVPTTSVGPIFPIDQAQIDPLRNDLLAEKLFNLYPYYAINFDLNNQNKNYNNSIIENVSNYKFNLSKQSDQIMFSFGYEGITVESFFNTLLLNNIYTLCDVRKNAFSYKFGFSKSILKTITGAIGVKYIHIPELGIDTALRKLYSSPSDYGKLFEIYKESLSAKTAYLDKLSEYLKSENRLVLMCMEKNPKDCHRTIILNYMAENYNIVVNSL